jgi:predicted phosphoadenosine phosphosulfate sulfurtransferase
MSNGHWQIDEQLLQLGHGKKTTERVRAYVEMWRKRCYYDGIPEQVPNLLQDTNRAPSWRKIAICLLKNDMRLRGLGFTEKTYDKRLIASIEAMVKTSDQLNLDL